MTSHQIAALNSCVSQYRQLHKRHRARNKQQAYVIRQSRLMICLICGYPVPAPSELVSGGAVSCPSAPEECEVEAPDQLEWLAKAVMLSEAAGKIQEDKVRAGTTSRDCILEKDGTCVLAYQGAGVRQLWKPYRIVVHAACLDIAERVMRTSARRRRCYVRSMGRLWGVLSARHDQYVRENVCAWWPCKYSSSWRMNIYLTFQSLRPSRCHHWRHKFHERDSAWLREDPTTTPDMTDLLLSKAKTLVQEPISPATEAFRRRFFNLPVELQDQIVLFLGSDGDLPSDCTRLLSPETWCDMLLGKKLLPFLYDIDETALEEKRETDIDWESLVRSLSRGSWIARASTEWKEQEEICRFYCDLVTPTGLRNRRRIWQIVEKMFVGDLRPSKRVLGLAHPP